MRSDESQCNITLGRLNSCCVLAADSSPSESTHYDGNVVEMDLGWCVFAAGGFILQATEEDGRGSINSSYDQR
jgi:hypothetical protein